MRRHATGERTAADKRRKRKRKNRTTTITAGSHTRRGMHVAHACKNRRLLRCWRSHGLSHLRARSGGGMFGLRVQSTRQSAHAKDLPATLGHTAHLKAIKRDARPHSPVAPAPPAASAPAARLRSGTVRGPTPTVSGFAASHLRPHAVREPTLRPQPRYSPRPFALAWQYAQNACSASSSAWVPRQTMEKPHCAPSSTTGTAR